MTRQEMVDRLIQYGARKSWTKEQLRKYAAAVAADLGHLIERHEKHRGCYFWRPGATAGERRRNSFLYHRYYGRLEVYQCREDSCRNVYYKLSVKVGSDLGDVRTLKKIVSNCREIAEA